MNGFGVGAGRGEWGWHMGAGMIKPSVIPKAFSSCKWKPVQPEQGLCSCKIELPRAFSLLYFSFFRDYKVGASKASLKAPMIVPELFPSSVFLLLGQGQELGQSLQQLSGQSCQILFSFCSFTVSSPGPV